MCMNILSRRIFKNVQRRGWDIERKAAACFLFLWFWSQHFSSGIMIPRTFMPLLHGDTGYNPLPSLAHNLEEVTVCVMIKTGNREHHGK